MSRLPTIVIVFLSGALCAPPTARAETYLVPVGAAPVRVPTDRIVCSDPSSSAAPFTVDADGRTVRAPSTNEAIGQLASVRLASDLAHCQGSTETLGLVATAPWPVVDASSLELDVEAGVVTARGTSMAHSLLYWSTSDASGEDRCTPSPTDPAVCTFAVPRTLPADASAISLVVLPEGARRAADVTPYDTRGRRLALADLTRHPSRVVLSRLVSSGASIDASDGVGHLVLSHPEGIASVDCVDALCDLASGTLTIRAEHGANDVLEIDVHLRPHVVVRRGEGFEANPILTIPLARCPVALASAPPIRGLGRPRVVLRVGGSCTADARFAVTADGSSASILDRRSLAGSLYLVVALDRVEGDEVELVLSRDAGIAASLRVPVRRVTPPRARIELPGLGVIDFLPTNRAARVLVPSLPEGGALVPIPVDGVYDLHRDAEGHVALQALTGVAGSVALRFAYRDPALPEALRETDLGVLTEPVERAIRVADVPQPLGGAEGRPPIVELLCDTPTGLATPLEPGHTAYLPFASRDTCRLVLHRERIDPADGTQMLTLRIDVAHSDGSPVAEARIEQRVILRPGDEPRTVFLGGAQNPFDRIIVRIGIADEGVDWAVRPEDRLDAPELAWSIVMGKDRFRIYGTTTIPAALFRISDAKNTGLMALNAGAIFRLVALTREGRETVVGLEGGVMWVSIGGLSSGASNASRYGELALVAGVGLGVPIANPSRASQTSIAIHAWLEYEVSRAFRHDAGSPLGFVFGPSITIGDVGSNF